MLLQMMQMTQIITNENLLYLLYLREFLIFSCGLFS